MSDNEQLTQEKAMTEFELQQLLLASRYEFDATTAFMTLLGFMVIALSRLPFTRRERQSLTTLYLLVQSFCVIRIVAAIVRFGTQSALLTAMDTSYHPGNAWLQLPTVVIRVVLVAALIYLGVRFLRTPHPEGEEN